MIGSESAKIRRAAQREMMRADDAVFARNRRALENVAQFPNVGTRAPFI
jgi:hypothetical protein